MKYKRYRARALLFMYIVPIMLQCTVPSIVYASHSINNVKELDNEDSDQEEDDYNVVDDKVNTGGPSDEDDELLEESKNALSTIPGNIKVSVGDIVVSDKVGTNVAGKPRVTEIYSLNNTLGDSFYKPKIDDINYLAERVLKSGEFAGAYKGFFDYNITEPYKPSGQTSRALEVLGYDFLLDSDTYDTEKKKHVFQYTNIVSRTTAIMNLYKALGLEMQSIYMYHESANYNQYNSPASKEVAGMFQYKVDGSSRGLDPYRTYVYVTRTDPILYMRKVYQDFNITDTSDNGQPVTYADFIVLSAKMMQFYGEPVMNQDEMYKLIQVYGAEVPDGISNEIKQAWMYLKSRGVLNCDISNYFSPISKKDFYDILMCIKDPSSRTDYKEIQLIYSLNDEMVSQGYYPQKVNITYSDSKPIESVVDYASCEALDYYIPVSEMSKFVGVSGLELNTMFVSNNKNITEHSMEVMPGSKYLGIEDGYYHFIIPIEVEDKAITEDGYLLIDTPDNTDYPEAIRIEKGGGILTPVDSTLKDSIVKFSRTPLAAYSYPDSVDEDRYKVAIGEDTEDEDVDVDDERTDDGVYNPSDLTKETFDDWEGFNCSLLDKHKVGQPGWIQDESNGKWRYTYKSGNDLEVLQGSGYKIVATTDKAISDNIYLFDNDGYAVSGWYQDGSDWYYFNPETLLLVSSTTISIDNSIYSFNRYGRMIKTPEDQDDATEDYDWAELNPISGQWVYDDDRNLWWFLLPDSDYIYDSICLINNKLYSFDDDGFMRTGWYKYNDNYYYFDLKQGHMLQNTTTPDGYTVDNSGRAINGYSTSFNNNPVKWLKEKITIAFAPITAFAAPSVSHYPTDGLGTLMYNTSGRLYKVNVYPSLYEESELELKNRIEGVLASVGGKLTTTSVPWTVVSSLSGNQILKDLSYKSKTNDYQLLSNNMAITNFGANNSMLVSLTQIIEAGLVSSKNISIEGDVLMFDSIGKPELLNDPVDVRGRSVGFGRIIINNKDKTIMVGSTIYRLSDKLTLWETVESADSVEPLTYHKADGTTAVLDKELYVDIRTMFGWTANELQFYWSNNKQNSLGNGKQIIITTSTSNVLTSEGKQSPAKASYQSINMYKVGGNNSGKEAMFIKCLDNYTSDGQRVLLLGNSYPIAGYSLLISQLVEGSSEQAYLVKYMPTALLAANGVTADAAQYDALKSYLGFAPKVTGYSAMVSKLTLGTKITNPGESGMIRGQIYQDATFGLIYYPPVLSEWDNSAKDGWKKYLTGEYQLPLTVGGTGSSGGIWDMSVPYIIGKPWGETKISSNDEIKNIMPMLTALSYFLWKPQEVVGNPITTVVESNGNNSGSMYYFGQNPIEIVGAGANAKLIIRGLTDSGNKKIELSGESIKSMLVYKVNTAVLVSGSDVSTEIFAIFPDLVNYDVASVADKDRTDISYGGASALDRYSSYADRTLRGLIEKASEFTNLVILITLYVVPIATFTGSVFIMGMAMMGEWKCVQLFCEKVFDPVWILTFGHRTLEEVRGPKFIKNMIIIATTSAFIMQGNIFRIMLFLLEVGGRYLSMMSGL